MKRLSIWLSVLCLLTLLVSPAFGQGRTTGTISGTVVDPQNAVVPNAQVTISDPGTGLTRTVTADANGFFSATELPASTYTVSVAQSGFKQYKATGVVLHVSSTVTLPIQLQVGEKTEVVNVEATDIQVQTDSAQLGEVVNGQQVRELPLNGRSFVQLTQLQPGVSAVNSFDSKNKGLLSGVDFSVNGNPNTNNLFLVDGANNNDVGSNRTILIYPSIEAIAEFKMLRNSYGAEYGQASGAVINIATRSGSNQFHGSVLYYGRNDALNSYEYFAAKAAAAAKEQTGTATPKDKLRRNDYGFSIGGPAIKDKLFFFYSEEWNKEIRGATRQACVPDAAARAGDFSTGIATAPTYYAADVPDPDHPGQFLHRAGDTNNAGQLTNCSAPIPTWESLRGVAVGTTGLDRYKMTSVDPVGSLLVANMPMPNLSTPLANGNNWILSVPSQINWRQENVRVDYNLNSANTIMGRYTQDHWDNPAPNYQPGGLWGDDPWTSIEGNWSQPSKQAVVKLTSTIGGTFVNDISFTYSANAIIITTGGTGVNGEGGDAFQKQISDAMPTAYPNSLKTASQRIPTIWGGFGAYGSGNNLWAISPWHNDLGIYTIRDDASKVKGNHTFKAGIFFGWDGKNEDASTSSSEGSTFGIADWDTNHGTGNPMASILYPNANWGQAETSTNTRVMLRWHDYEGYVADTWKARRNLTLDLGVRYSWLPYPHSPSDSFVSFQPGLFDPAKGSDACNGLWIVPGTNYCTQANSTFGTNFSAGTPGPNNTLMYTNKHMFAPRLGVAWDPWGDGNTSVRAGFGMFYQRERVSPSYVNEANAPFAVTVNLSHPLGVAGNPSGANTSPAGGRDPQAVVPVSFQWNLSVERGFAKNTTLSIGYVGNRAEHLTANWDVNQIDPANWVNGAFSNTNMGVPNNQNCYRPYGKTYDASGVLTGCGWGSLNYWGHNGDATYHSLQTLFKTRYKRSELQAAYTWSHSIANVQLDNSSGGLGAQAYTVPSDPSIDRGNSAINRPHVFVANAIFNLPELKDRSGLVKNVLGGWELGLIQSAAAGNSFTIYQNGIGQTGGNLGSLQGTGYTNYQRPLITGEKCQGTGEQIVNPGAFTLIGYAIGTLPGNTEPRGYCAGPKYVNTDLSINKNWQVPFIQNEKMRIQFRVDLFNAFNHANFRPDQIQGTAFQNVAGCGPTQSLCTPTNNVISAVTPQNGFGASTRTSGAREIQYGLKLIF